MAGRLPLALFLGYLVRASSAGAVGSAATPARTAQLRAGAPPVKVEQEPAPSTKAASAAAPVADAVRLHDSGPSRWAETGDRRYATTGDVYTASDANHGKWGKVADLFSDISAPLARGMSSAARYFAPGRGLSSIRKADDVYEKNFVALAMTFLIVAALTALVAHYYEARRHADQSLAGRRAVVERVPMSHWAARDVVDPRRWLQEKEICLMSCCCPCIRWADTVSMVGIMSFWYAFLAYLFIVYMDAITTGTVFWLALVVMCTHYRSRIREVFSLSNVTWGAIFADFCCFCWCMPCAIAQEARNVDMAVREGEVVEEVVKFY